MRRASCSPGLPMVSRHRSASSHLANFVNPQGLQQLGDTAWGESFQSGDALLGEAGTASFGNIQSGALEASNVDLTAQLVQMITAQRNFQANAQADFHR